ncbi:MAG: S8 family serine peptidase [Armatimonadetes bacterium]|nr:S8 family serine peptidase [Armatimonadota bacterium]
MVVRRLLRFLAATAVVSMLALMIAGSVLAEYRQGEILIRYKPGRQLQTLVKAAAISAKLTQSIDQIRYQRLKLPKGMSVEQAMAKFKNDPSVEYVGPNHVLHFCRAPNDDIFVNGMYVYFEIDGWVIIDQTFYQWWLDDGSAGIDAQQAWDIATGEGSDIIIAIVDSGIKSDHEDLSAKIIPGRNTILGEDPTNTDDDVGHGTDVAGVAAAMTNNSIGIAGICWGAKLMPVKIIKMDEYGIQPYGTDADGAAGIIWAADHGAKIINMSFGDYVYNLSPGDTIIKDAVDYAWNKGCVLVGGSGNDGVTDQFYPACYDNVIAVGATNESGQRATALDWGGGGSNYGPWLDVVAPGTNMLSTTNIDTGYGYGFYDAGLSGTSFATPVVTGVAALLWSKYPTWTNAQIANQIKMTCKDIGAPGRDDETGFGLVSAYRALSLTPENGKTIGQLADIASNNAVIVTNAVITGGSTDLADRLYIEQPDRASGIMLPFTTKPTGFVEGDRVNVIGTLMTISGERAIQGAGLTKVGSDTPLKPIGMPTKAVGGTSIGLKSGITNGNGTNNIGLLVTVYGRITTSGWNYMYIDDGAKLQDGSGMNGLKIITDSFTKPSTGYMRVTGIVSVEQPTPGVSIPVIRVRRQSDILPVN